MTTPDDLLTTRQAAEVLGVNASRVRQLILAGRLPARKMSRDNMIRAADLALVARRVRTGRPKRPRPA